MTRINIEWKMSGGYKSGYALTASGKKAFISSIMNTSSRSRRELFSCWVQGVDGMIATRATIETIIGKLEQL